MFGGGAAPYRSGPRTTLMAELLFPLSDDELNGNMRYG
jgi:hypothetical protein